MTTPKEGNTEPSQPILECCMCGDYGLSFELFRCRVCQFRSQHRYCSNLYPKAESYLVCNWCLISQKDDTSERKQNSSNSSSSNKYSEDDNKAKEKNIGSDTHRGLKAKKLQLSSSPIKKPKSVPKRSPSLVTGRRIITRGGIEERLRRTKSDEISNSGIIKHVFRNKVRRYKLLDEVSSQ